jgi:phosphatidylglycerophosphatase A
MSHRQRLPISVLKNPVHVLATGFGSGCAPFAPGTFGTLVAVPFAWLGAGFAWPIRGLAVAALFGVGIWICAASARRLGVHDHPGIVWDEIVGYLATALAAPPGLGGLVAAFGLFRLFDIVKPWPIRDLDHSLHGGLGIMLDDLAAAGYAALCLLIYQYFFP